MWFQVSIWSTIVITVGSNLGILFSIAFACKPIKKSYDITITEGTCINRAAVFKATAAFGIITDVLIFMVPIPMIIGLHLSRSKKAGLFLLFTIGSATVVTSIVRLCLLFSNLSNPDTTWIGGPIFLWVFIEANLLVICSCLPTVKLFVQAIAPSLLGVSSVHGPSGSHTGPWQSSGYRANAITTTTSSRPKPKKDHYHDFEGDQDYRMQTLVGRGDPIERGTIQRDPDSSGDKDRDDDSAKAIIQTRSLEIYYEDHTPER